MYTLVNGKRVENLPFITGQNGYEISPYYWYHNELVYQAYNTETGEIKIINRKGETVETAK